MVKSLVPIGQKTAVKFVFLDTFSTRKEYQPISYVEENLAEMYCVAQPVLMTDEMAHFIGMNCRCVYCKKRTRKLANRKEKLIDAGRFTKSQIEQLMSVQDNCCFYCACSLINEHEKQIYHVDHYVSLLDGGKNEISNLVLACPKCNLRKGAEDPSIFIRRRNKDIGTDQKEKATAIRKKVKAYKKRLKPLVKPKI